MVRTPSPPRRRRSKSRERDRERRRDERKDREERKDRDRRRSRSRDRIERRRRSPEPRERERDREHDRRREERRRSYSRSRSRSRSGDRGYKNKAKNSMASRPAITDADLEGKTEEEQEMMKMLGFCHFNTSKNKKVEGNEDGAVHVILKRKYRQYMNRKGGFNRPLDFVA